MVCVFILILLARTRKRAAKGAAGNRIRQVGGCVIRAGVFLAMPACNFDRVDHCCVLAGTTIGGETPLTQDSS